MRTGSRWRSSRMAPTGSPRASSPDSHVAAWTANGRSSRACRSTSSRASGSTRARTNWPRSASRSGNWGWWSSEGSDPPSLRGTDLSLSPFWASGGRGVVPPALLADQALALQLAHHAVHVVRLDLHLLGDLAGGDAGIGGDHLHRLVAPGAPATAATAAASCRWRGGAITRSTGTAGGAAATAAEVGQRLLHLGALV